MVKAGRSEFIDYNKQREALEDFVIKNKSTDILAKELDKIIFTGLVSGSKQQPSAVSSVTRYGFEIKGFSELGLKDSEVRALAMSFPGDWLSSLTYNSRASHPSLYGLKHGPVIASMLDEKGKTAVYVHDPSQDVDELCAILPTGLIFAFAGNLQWNSFPANLQNELENIFADLPHNVFRSTYINSIRNPGRHRLQAHADFNQDLLASFLKTIYNAPFADEYQDWQDAAINAFRGMQQLNSKQAESLTDVFAKLFYFLDPHADMNHLIRMHQSEARKIEIKIMSNRLAQLFSHMQDKGWQSFFRRWMTDLARLEAISNKQAASLSRHDRVIGPRVAMAMDSARELDAGLTQSLRVARASKTAKQRAMNDLRCSLRRFNDIWKDLDKREQQYMRPKLMQIIHVANH